MAHETLNVHFDNRHLRDNCSSQTSVEAWIGAMYAAPLTVLLADIDAAENCAELLDLMGDQAATEGDSLLVRIGPNCVVRFRALGANIQPHQNGEPEWPKILRLMLMEVVAD